MVLCENVHCKHCFDGVCRFSGTLKMDSDGECKSQAYIKKKVEDVLGKKYYMAYLLMGEVIEGSKVEIEYLKEQITLPKVMVGADAVGLVDDFDKVMWIDSIGLSHGEQVTIDIDLMAITR